MLKKILIILLIPILLHGCGYTKLYTGKNEKNINIEIITINGDKELNSLIRSNLKRFANKDGEKIYLKIITKYSITDLSKNLKGSISNYQLTANATFDIEKKDFNKVITIQENFIMTNLSDNLEKRNYERSIKKNFSNSIVDRLILQLATIK